MLDKLQLIKKFESFTVKSNEMEIEIEDMEITIDGQTLFHLRIPKKTVEHWNWTDHLENKVRVRNIRCEG